MSRHALKTRRSIRRPAMRVVVAISTSMVVAASVLTVGAVTRSDASWTDSEHAADSAGVVDCAAANGAFTTRGEGRMVSGSILGTDTDTAAAVSGMLVTNDGVTPQPQPSGARHANDGAGGTDPNAFVHPLDATTFGGIDVDLGPGGMVDLASILQLPLDNSTGVLNQYGRAASDGTSAAGSGFVTDSGAVAAADAGGGYPDLGSIDLKTLVAAVNPDVAAGLSDIAGAQLTIGAVSGRESMDGCAAAFNSPASALTREYLMAGLGANVSSGTVGALVTGLEPTLTTLESTVNNIASQDGVLTGIVSGVTSLLNSSLLSLTGPIDAHVSATIDLAPVRALLTNRFGDSGGLLTIDPGRGTVQVDLVALLAAAYPSQFSNGLNGLQPNTHLLINEGVVNTLSPALAEALASWVSHVQTALNDAVNRIKVSASFEVAVSVPVCPLGICVPTAGTLGASISGSLKDLQDGKVVATPTLKVLGLNIGAALQGLLDTLGAGLGKTVGDAVAQALTLPVQNVVNAANALTAPVVNAISGLFTALFVNGIVTLDVNAQNSPSVGNPAPVDWAALPAGQYDIAALRVGVLDGLGSSNVALYLGRASVGPTCSLADTGCASY